MSPQKGGGGHNSSAMIYTHNPLVETLSHSSGHFVQQRETILPILVEGHQRNISVKEFLNQAIGL